MAGGQPAPSALKVKDFRERPSVLKWIAIVLTALIVLSGLGFAAWYFLIRIPSMEPEPVVLKEPMPAEQIEKPPVIEEPIIVETPPANLNIPPPVPITPGVSSATETSRENLQPTEGKDADADGLTDAEEILYGTDQTKKDTDDDGFMDGSEVMSLYSPTAKSWPLSAEQSMQKQTWKNWNFMIPGVWSLTEDPVFPERLIITTDESARIKVEAETLPPDSTLEQWAPANFQPYKSFSTKNGVQVLQPQSSLNVYYAALGDSILIVTYDLNGDLSFEYRTSLMMFINSLKR